MGVSAWGHYLAMTAPEGQQAGHPIPMCERSNDQALAIVDDAPVPHQVSTGGRGDQFTERGDTVLVGHGTGFLVGWNWINLPPGLILGRQVQ